MSVPEIIQLITFLISLLSTAVATWSARVANRTRSELQAASNTDDIKLLNVRLDQMAIADGVALKEGDAVRIRLVGLSGDNGLVHDIIKLKNEVAYLNTQMSVVSDRLQMEIGKIEEDRRKPR